MAVREIKKAHFAFTLEFVVTSLKLLSCAPPSSVILWFVTERAPSVPAPAPTGMSARLDSAPSRHPKRETGIGKRLGKTLHQIPGLRL